MLQLPVLQNRANPPPECFGSHWWDPKSAECIGGPDPAYSNPKTGSHVRERCTFFSACGAKVQASRAGAQLQQQPTQQPGVTPLSSYHFPAVQRPSVSAGAARTQVAPMSQPMFSGGQPYQQQQVPQQMMMQQPQHWHPAPTYQFQHGLPNYLSVPEPRMHGETIWQVLLRELVRGAIKAFGHTLAYFIDTTPMRKQPPPPPTS